MQNNNFINCDKGLHIDNRGVGGEKPDCQGADVVGLRAAMKTPAWAKYGLSDIDISNNISTVTCAPINASAINNCFKDNKQNWEVWCGKDPVCMNGQYLGHESGNHNGTCGM